MVKIKLNSKLLSIPVLLGLLSMSPYFVNRSYAFNEDNIYNQEIGSKIVSRCDIIKEYLSKTVRISELAARQNRVRGWEYILRRLDNLEEGYIRFNVDHSELASALVSLRQQLEQFKVDFEAYDGEFQRLLSVSCKLDPQNFWKQLETLRSFRSGIALSAENYTNNLNSAISVEDKKW
ncbi:MAG: hypothetical protein H6799_02470 [Candidatus Nomurabacteria bacterium]|nr:MAG: hypothetical protein H6799_02470 [Candidatus Nomurabacteria bacterium]HRV75843.1 hypothetical protein [Candidatus Saccharimonadales bacterium]